MGKETNTAEEYRNAIIKMMNDIEEYKHLVSIYHFAIVKLRYEKERGVCND